MVHIVDPSSKLTNDRVRHALSRLEHGDCDAVVAMLDPKVSWLAIAAREERGAALLDHEGAKRYLQAMTRSIRGRRHQLKIIDFEVGGDTVSVVSQWLGSGRAGVCRNRFELQGGQIVNVVEKVVNQL